MTNKNYVDRKNHLFNTTCLIQYSIVVLSLISTQVLGQLRITIITQVRIRCCKILRVAWCLTMITMSTITVKKISINRYPSLF